MINQLINDISFKIEFGIRNLGCLSLLVYIYIYIRISQCLNYKFDETGLNNKKNTDSNTIFLSFNVCKFFVCVHARAHVGMCACVPHITHTHRWYVSDL